MLGKVVPLSVDHNPSSAYHIMPTMRMLLPTYLVTYKYLTHQCEICNFLYMTTAQHPPNCNFCFCTWSWPTTKQDQGLVSLLFCSHNIVVKLNKYKITHFKILYFLKASIWTRYIIYLGKSFTLGQPNVNIRANF